jgi:hypothetical protein
MVTEKNVAEVLLLDSVSVKIKELEHKHRQSSSRHFWIDYRFFLAGRHGLTGGWCWWGSERLAAGGSSSDFDWIFVRQLTVVPWQTAPIFLVRCGCVVLLVLLSIWSAYSRALPLVSVRAVTRLVFTSSARVRAAMRPRMVR